MEALLHFAMRQRPTPLRLMDIGSSVFTRALLRAPSRLHRLLPRGLARHPQRRRAPRRRAIPALSLHGGARARDAGLERGAGRLEQVEGVAPRAAVVPTAGIPGRGCRTCGQCQRETKNTHRSAG